MNTIHERIKTAIKESDYDYKSLSLAIGQGERYISNLLGSKSDPGFSTVVKICSVLGITPNHMVGISDTFSLVAAEQDDRIIQAHAEKLLASVTRETHRKLQENGLRPSIDDVLSWWHQENGRLRNFETISHMVDLFYPPNPAVMEPVPYQVGNNSLASVSFGIQDVRQLRSLMNTFDPDLKKKIAFAHVESGKGSPVVTVEELDVTLPGRAFPARFRYVRLLLPVYDEEGNKYILNYSKALE